MFFSIQVHVEEAEEDGPTGDGLEEERLDETRLSQPKSETLLPREMQKILVCEFCDHVI